LDTTLTLPFIFKNLLLGYLTTLYQLQIFSIKSHMSIFMNCFEVKVAGRPWSILRYYPGKTG